MPWQRIAPPSTFPHMQPLRHLSLVTRVPRQQTSGQHALIRRSRPIQRPSLAKEEAPSVDSSSSMQSSCSPEHKAHPSGQDGNFGRGCQKWEPCHDTASSWCSCCWDDFKRRLVNSISISPLARTSFPRSRSRKHSAVPLKNALLVKFIRSISGLVSSTLDMDLLQIRHSTQLLYQVAVHGLYGQHLLSFLPHFTILRLINLHFAPLEARFLWKIHAPSN